MESICLWFKQNVELYTSGFGLTLHKIKLTGGLSRYPILTQIKADVMDCAIDVPDYHDLALLGAAIIAGIGVGEYSSWDDPYRSIHLPMSTFIPNPDNVSFYKKRYERYKKVATTLENTI
jgi:sugar (pentulose or hexulose) kinase